MKKNFFGKLFGLTLLMFTLLFTGASAETYEGTGLGYDKDGIVLDVEITKEQKNQNLQHLLFKRLLKKL